MRLWTDTSLVQNDKVNRYRAWDPWILANAAGLASSMIETAELVAERYGISREAQDEYALQSQQRIAQAQTEGRFDREIVPLTTVMTVTPRCPPWDRDDVLRRRHGCRRPIRNLLMRGRDMVRTVDVAVAVRAGKQLPFCNQGHVRHRFHDAVLVATAQAYGHGLLSKRETVFGPWTKVAVASP